MAQDAVTDRGRIRSICVGTVSVEVVDPVNMKFRSGSGVPFKRASLRHMTLSHPALKLWSTDSFEGGMDFRGSLNLDREENYFN